LRASAHSGEWVLPTIHATVGAFPATRFGTPEQRALSRKYEIPSARPASFSAVFPCRALYDVMRPTLSAP
jgi:hypothetical protein